MLIFLLLMLPDASGIHAQAVSLYDVVYRPPGENWLRVSDGSFEVIYPDQHELQARELLSALRETRAGTDAFLGVDRHAQPVCNAGRMAQIRSMICCC